MPDNRLRTDIARWLIFGLTIVASVVILKLFNWIPSALQQEDMRKFRTLDEAQASMKSVRIAVPAYFPQHVKWPPMEVFAQKKPFVLVMMHFSHADSGSLSLSLYQFDARAAFEPPALDRILFVRQETPVKIRGRDGILRLAVCQGNVLCNNLAWERRGFRFVLVSDDRPEELLRMAESME